MSKATKQTISAATFLVLNRVPFQAVQTSNTLKIETENNVFFESTGEKLKPSELGFINGIKMYNEKHTDFEKLPEKGQVRYYDFFCSNGTYTNYVEVDVNAAYWNIAYQKGYISKQVFNSVNDKENALKEALKDAQGKDKEAIRKEIKGLKRLRLIALGNLATNKRYWSFDGVGGIELEDEIRNPTAPIFYDISREMGTILNDISAKFDILFWWVDAVFIEASQVNELYWYLQSNYNLSAKLLHTEKVVVTEEVVEVYTMGEAMKPFYRPKGKITGELMLKQAFDNLKKIIEDLKKKKRKK